MRIIYSDEFYHEYKKLPVRIQARFQEQVVRFQKDTRDSRLHTKKLAGDSTTFSFRMTSSYRALFYFQTDTIVVFLTIGHRKDIYRKK